MGGLLRIVEHPLALKWNTPWNEYWHKYGIWKPGTAEPKGGKPAKSPMKEKRTIRREVVPNLTDEEREAVLARDVSATLAFVDKDGYPRMVPCWFHWDGNAFFVTSDPNKFHVRCLRRDGRASICVEVEDVVVGQRRSNRQVKAVGQVEIFDDTDDQRWWRTVRAKYLTAADLPDVIKTSTPRVVLKLVPRQVTAHGGGTVSTPTPS